MVNGVFSCNQRSKSVTKLTGMREIFLGFNSGRRECFLLLAVVIWALGGSMATMVEASIHDYRNESFIPKSNAFFFHGGSEGLYASKHLNTSSHLHGDSFVSFEGIAFARPLEAAMKNSRMQQSTGVIEAILLEVKDRDRIGGSFLNTDALCCEPSLAAAGQCKLGEVIIHTNPENPNWPKRFKINFAGRSEIAVMDTMETVYIERTGMYYLYFMFCDKELEGTIIRGKTIWKNPNGYLPGKMMPLMSFYGLMSLAYLSLGLVWFLRFVRYWKDAIHLHYCITAVIALGMCEMAVWYFEYGNFNSTGVRPMGVTLWAVTLTTVKKSLSRLLLLVVSMGYGVVKPTLGGLTSRILLLGSAYFVACEALELLEHLGNINDYSKKTELFLVLPVAFIDSCFIFWIFSSLSKTLENLQIKRNALKLELYRKFTNSLAVSILVSIAWIGFELYFNASDPLSELWKMAWIVPAFWTLLAYALLVVICFLWAPSANPTRYAYSEGDDFEEEGILFTGTLPPDIQIKHERKVLGDDLEEDKRQ